MSQAADVELMLRGKFLVRTRKEPITSHVFLPAYRSQWVAMVDDTVMAASPDIDEVYRRTESMTKTRRVYWVRSDGICLI